MKETEGNLKEFELPIQNLNKHQCSKCHSLKSECLVKADIMDNCLIAHRLYERLTERNLLTLYCPVNVQSRKQKTQDKKEFYMLSQRIWVALHPHVILIGYASMSYNALFFPESGTQLIFKPRSRH